jgi:hypothetical protein
MDGVVAGQLWNFCAMDEDPHARKMTGVVGEGRDPHPKQRRECNGAQAYVKRGTQPRSSDATDGALGRLGAVNGKRHRVGVCGFHARGERQLRAL